MTVPYLIDCLSGYCPVQGEGFIGPLPGGQVLPFYFRARGQRWEFSIAHTSGAGVDAAVDVGLDRGEPAGWYRWEPWGDEPYAAGYMPHEEAERIIGETIAYWAREVLPGLDLDALAVKALDGG